MTADQAEIEDGNASGYIAILASVSATSRRTRIASHHTAIMVSLSLLQWLR